MSVLDDISLTYESGKIYGLAGENGAGKTTLFDCMANLTPHEGEVEHPKQTTLGYLPAECFFYPLVTGREYIEFCLRACGKKDFSREHQRNKCGRIPAPASTVTLQNILLA